MEIFTTYLDIPYAGQHDPRRALDLFIPHSSDSASPLICFIHGGAWRSESKEDHRNHIVPSLIRQTNLPVACLEYRLAPQYRHPTQVNDCLAGLQLLSGSLLTLENNAPKWDRKRIYVVGHSVGAFMASSIVLKSRVKSPSFVVEDQVRKAIQGIICVDGIYDLPTLLDEYPSYSSFVDQVFEKDDKVHQEESPARWTLYDESESDPPPPIFVVHSKGDELLSLRQPEFFVEKAKKLYKLEETGEDWRLRVDYDVVNGTHAGVLRETELARVVAKWVSKLEARRT